MRKKTILLSLLALAVLSAAAIGNAGGAGTGTKDCGDGHTLTWTPTSIWPPNHKLETVTLTYKDSDDSHTLTLTITGVTHDQMTDGEEWNGSGNTSVDWVPSGNESDTGQGEATASTQIRAERSGHGKDGRTYTISYEAKSMDANGNQDNDCGGTVTVNVPHDCRGGACRVIDKSSSGAKR